MAIGNPITLTSNVASKTISAIATAGQTLFTVTGGYRINQLAVFRNGVRLLDSRDYEARNGSTVTLLSAATVGDALEFQVFDDFRVADAIVSAESEQTIQGNLTVAGILTATNLSVTDLSLRHLKATGISTVSDTTQSTSTTTGAFIVSGGVGIAKSLYVGGNVSVGGTISYEDVTNVDSVGIITARSHVSIADSILHTGDTDTAIRFPAADNFTVETGGSERFRVGPTGIATFTGNVSLTAGGAERLNIAHVSGGDVLIKNPTDAYLAFGTNDSERVRITNTGLVGIGTVNPTGNLEINAASTTDMIRLHVAGTNFAKIGHNSASGTNILDVRSEGHMRFLTNGNNERFRITNGGTIYTTNATAAGSLGVGTDSPGMVSGMSRYLTLSAAAADNAVGFELHGNRSGNDEPVARISFVNRTTECARITIDSDASGTPAGGNMLFATGGSTERMRITSEGNVDINGTPPWTVTGGNYRNLSISGSDASSSGFLWLGNGAAATNADFDLGRVNFVNGANIVAQIKGTTQTSANDDGRISFFTKATGTNISEKVRISSTGRVAIGTISDYSAGVTNAPVYISMQSNMTGIGDHEGDATAGLVRLEETGSNDGRLHGIELRNKNSGDIRFFNQDQSTLDRGDLLLIMPDQDANDGTHLKMRVNSLKSSIQISGKGGAVAGNAQENHTDIYIATKTGMTAVNTGLGAEVAGLIRFEDKGSNNSRYHGIELRNRNSGDARILNLDEGTTNKANLVFAIDNGSTVVESLRLNSAGNAVFAGTVEDSIGPLRRLGIQGASSSFTLAADHAGKLVRMNSSAQTITLPQNIFTAGDMISIFNVSTGDTTIAQGTGATLYNSSDGSTGNRTLGAKGICTIVCSASNEFVISGSNLS